MTKQRHGAALHDVRRAAVAIQDQRMDSEERPYEAGGDDGVHDAFSGMRRAHPRAVVAHAAGDSLKDGMTIMRPIGPYRVNAPLELRRL
jgi:hypothetical protein